MAHPMDKMTRSKRGMRRSHDFLTKPGVSTCSNCGSTKKPHTVCPSCGHYKGKLIEAPKN